MRIWRDSLTAEHGCRESLQYGLALPTKVSTEHVETRRYNGEISNATVNRY